MNLITSAFPLKMISVSLFSHKLVKTSMEKILNIILKNNIIVKDIVTK